jgi:hypothetical protein
MSDEPDIGIGVKEDHMTTPGQFRLHSQNLGLCRSSTSSWPASAWPAELPTPTTTPGCGWPRPRCVTNRELEHRGVVGCRPLAERVDRTLAGHEVAHHHLDR